MKIYWKSLIWNYTLRYWHLFLYYKQGLYKSKCGFDDCGFDDWRGFYYPNKRFWNSKQWANFHHDFIRALGERN